MFEGLIFFADHADFHRFPFSAFARETMEDTAM